MKRGKSIAESKFASHVGMTDEPLWNISEVISSEEYSSVSRLYSVTACVLRFLENLKQKRREDILCTTP